jgi:folate-dependent phosphoribosylglycinamide formyltransferase PurN
VLPEDTADTLHERIKVVERQLLLDVVGDFAAGRLPLPAQPPQGH